MVSAESKSSPVQGNSVFAKKAANDAETGKVAECKVVSLPGGGQSEHAAIDQSRNNLIKRTVDEIYGLMADVHEIREEILARGVRFHMLNLLIEMGVSDKQSELEKLIVTALEAAKKEQGSQAIKREHLEKYLKEIITLEKDLRHIRHVAGQQGVSMQPLSHLIQLMRLNPGDKGVQAINTFVAYADAAGVQLDRLDEIRAQYKDEPDSVLPDISREEPNSKRKQIFKCVGDVAFGTVLTVVVMWLVL